MDAEQSSSWVELLTIAARTGRVVVLGEGSDSAAERASRGEAVPFEQRVPADGLRQVLLAIESQFDPRGLTIRGAHIEGKLDLKYASLPCLLRLDHCFIPEGVDLKGCQLPLLDLTGSYCTDLDMDDTHVDGNVFAADLRTQGTVRAMGANIDGRLVLRGAELTNLEGDALVLDGAQIDGGVFAEGLMAQGTVRAMGARIGDQLNLQSAWLHIPEINAPERMATDGDALVLDWAQIERDVFAWDLWAQGGVRAFGARIGGSLSLRRAELSNPNGDALFLERAQIEGDVFAWNLRAQGTVHAKRARIGGQLFLEGTRLNIPEVNAPERMATDGDALVLDWVQIEGDVFAWNLRAQGTVHAKGARIGGSLSLRRAKLTSPKRQALNLEGASIRILDLKDIGLIKGDLVLAQAQIGSIATNEHAPPESLGRLVATGWNVGDVQGWLRDDDRAAQSWLRAGDDAHGFVPQPWHELARVYDRIDHTAQARRLRYRAAVHTTRQQPWLSRTIARVFYGGLVGYGYYPLRTLGWFAFSFLLAWVLIASNAESFVPTNQGDAQAAYLAHLGAEEDQEVVINGALACEYFAERYPCFQPWSYAAAITTPASALHVPVWTPSTPWLESVLMGLQVLGWALTVFLLAGLTGLLRKT